MSILLTIQECWALLNQNSQMNIIKALAKRLTLYPVKHLFRVLGTTAEASGIRQRTSCVELEISRCTRFRISLSYLLIDRIISNIPNFRISEIIPSYEMMMMMLMICHLSEFSILDSMRRKSYNWQSIVKYYMRGTT